MRYIRLIPALLLGAMLAACNTTKKLYEAQEYDEVIQRVAPDICGGDMNAKRINYVAASYHKANQADHERIQALKATGQPDVWPEIYQRYCSMKGRNDALACFPREVKRGMNYVKLDLDDDMAAARNKAESFLVAKANQLLGTGSKTDAKEARKYIEQLYATNPQNTHLQELQGKCLLRSADNVLVTYDNKDRRDLPREFVATLMDFDAGELPQHCVTERDKRTDYEAVVVVVIKSVEVSPSRLDEVTFKESNGSALVEVTDHSQTKHATVKGTIRFASDINARPVREVPFEVTSTFKNDYTTIRGDREACSAETLGRLNSQPVPIPTDESMLLDAAKKLNDLVATELKK